MELPTTPASVTSRNVGFAHVQKQEDHDHAYFEKTSFSILVNLAVMLSALAKSTLRTARGPVSKVIARNYNPYYTVMSSPPTHRVSFAEKVILGGGMCVSLLVVPAWVLCSVNKWNGAEN